MERSIVGIVYIIVGVVVASNNGYLASLMSLPGALSAILAVVLWPLVLLGVSLHLAF